MKISFSYIMTFPFPENLETFEVCPSFEGTPAKIDPRRSHEKKHEKKDPTKSGCGASKPESFRKKAKDNLLRCV